MSFPSTRALPRGLSRGVAALAVTGLTLAGLAAPALAHVEAEGDTDAAGLTTLTFSFTHGCGDSPTTSLRVQLPGNAFEVKAQDQTGWTSSVTATELTWTGGSIPSSTPGAFVATMVVAGAAGDVVFFPTIQGCAQGEEDWIEKTTDPEAENAAPRITLTQTVAPPSSTTTSSAAGTTSTTAKGTTTTAKASTTTAGPSTTKADAGTTTTKGVTATAVPTTTEPSSSSSTGAILAGIIAAVVLVVGVGAFLLGRRAKAGDAAAGAGAADATATAEGSGADPTSAGTSDAATRDPGAGDPGAGEPGTGEPGTGEPGVDPTPPTTGPA